MESTPRPITGYPSQRISLPLAGLTRGMRRWLRPMRLELYLVRQEAEEAVLEVRGGVDARGAERLKEAVALAWSEGARRLTIDLSGATRIAPSGVAALVEVSQRMGPTALRLVRLSPELRQLLERADLHRVLEIGE